MIMSIDFSNFNTDRSHSDLEDGIDEDILAQVTEELEDDPEFQAWLAREEDISPDPDDETDQGVWVPLGAADRSWADQLAEKHPDPDFAEHLRQMTLAAAALTRYLESHGIEVDRSAAHHNHAVVQLLNPTADVVLPNLGRLEAVLVQTTEDNRSVVEVDLASGTLAYMVVSLEGGGARLQGILLCSDLCQDWPEGGTVPVTMAKPLDELWVAYRDWCECQRITTEWSQNKGKELPLSPQERSDLITRLNFVLYHEERLSRQSAPIRDFMNEKSGRDRAVSHENLMAVREEGTERGEGTEQTSPEPPAIDWLAAAEDWLNELRSWKESP
ncbi:MAG: DUF1822 family protein [Prochlorotrichaceae cyanobacterium]|jgi:hypothetical protein